MNKALIVSKTEETLKAFSVILNEEGYTDIASAHNVDEAKNFLENEVFDLVFINTPLPEENGMAFSKYCAEVTMACVVVAISGRSISGEILDACSKCGVLVIAKPINRHLFHHYLMFTDYFKQRMVGVIEENTKLKNMVEEIKLIDRAKYVLIQTLSMSEAQAHRYIEKQAMDMRLTRVQIAKQVLKTYDK